MGSIATYTPDSVALLLQMQAGRLQYTVDQWLPNWRCWITDSKHGKRYLALCLGESWGYYDGHFAAAGITIQMLIVHRHNAFVGLPVLSLETSSRYEPGYLKKEQSQAGHHYRRTSDQKKALISGIIMGVEHCRREIEQMPERTARHYRAEAKRFISPRRGRPMQEIGA